MKILILDDDWNRHKQFKKRFVGATTHHVETVGQCILALQMSCWDALFLDHDLGGQQMVESGDNTGYAVAVWLRDNPGYKAT